MYHVCIHACLREYTHIHICKHVAYKLQPKAKITSSLVYCLGKYVCRITTNCFTIASESIKDEFTASCKLLENIVNCWEAGMSVFETNAFTAKLQKIIQ